MTLTKQIIAYWNQNRDPLNWRGIDEGDLPGVWQKAVSTYLSPDICYAISRMGALHGKRILLLGAGLGQGVVPLSRMGAEVIGLDISATRCELAEKMLAGNPEGKKVSFIVGNAENVPFPNGYFHFVLEQDVLMYTDPVKVVRECQRVLALGGKAVFVESMDGHPIMKLFRMGYYGKNMRGFTRHLKYGDIKRLSAPGLCLDRISGFYFLSIIAFAALYFLRSVSLHKLFLSVLYPIDCVLLNILPGLSNRTWKGVAVYCRKGMPAFEKAGGIQENLT